MSLIQRRNSQRLAHTLEALTEDLEVESVQTEVDENVDATTPQEYWGDKAKGDQAIQLMGEQAEEVSEESFDQTQDEDDVTTEQDSIMQGDPGVEEFGSQLTNDSDDCEKLDFVPFDGDEAKEDTIRAVPGRAEKQARIKKLIARIEKVADKCERIGKKSLAYRLDIVCNNLQAKYLNK